MLQSLFFAALTFCAFFSISIYSIYTHNHKIKFKKERRQFIFAALLEIGNIYKKTPCFGTCLSSPKQAIFLVHQVHIRCVILINKLYIIYYTLTTLNPFSVQWLTTKLFQPMRTHEQIKLTNLLLSKWQFIHF